MAEKTKSIIEEALLDAKSLEDALKANTKEMLSAHMSKEIESIVESSLKEQEEDEETIEVDDAEIEGSADDVEGVELLDLDTDSEGDSEEIEMDVADLPDEEDEVSDVLDLDADLDLDAGEGDEEVELDLEPMAIDMGMDDEVLDMTMASDDEVVSVFKKLGPDDEVEVVKDADGIHLTDNETGAEYYIKESLDEMMDEDEGVCEGCGSNMEEDDSMEEETIYEIEMDETETVITDEDDSMEEEEEVDEGLARTRGGARQGNRRGGASHNPKPKGRGRYESKKTRKPVVSRKPKTNTVAESKIMKEYKELKSKNNEYKKALNVFKDKLNEVALFNTNLAYVNRLFTEHSTTKKEKMEILKRFDNAESVKESKSIYKTIKTELDRKAPISESVENKVNKTVKSSKSDLNESTAYVDPQITAIKDLMKRIS